MTPATRANQNSHAAARSAIRCAREDEFCASVTRRWMPARAVSSPTAVTSTRRPESVATVPATTVSPSPRRTGRDSPVIIDSSMLAEPCGSGRRRGPGRRAGPRPGHRAAGRSVRPARPRRRRRRSASSGSSAASESRAEVVWARDRISIQWPSSMITISSASSHQKSSSWSTMPRLAAQRRHERDGDRQSDQQHHPRLTAAELVDGTGQERPPAPHVHDGAEQRRDPAHPAGSRAGCSRAASRTCRRSRSPAPPGPA